MAKKVILTDQNNLELMPITRGELVLDSSGQEAFRSNTFLATISQPGLMSETDKEHVNCLKNNNVNGFITDQENDWILSKNNGIITWKKLPEYLANSICEYTPESISLSQEWTASGFILNANNGFTTGTYIIKIIIDNLIFSGITSVCVGEIDTEDEIVLHMSGKYSSNQKRIYAKIAPNQSSNYGEIYLAINIPQSAITNLSITMKKLL